MQSTILVMGEKGLLSSHIQLLEENGYIVDKVPFAKSQDLLHRESPAIILLAPDENDMGHLPVLFEDLAEEEELQNTPILLLSSPQDLPGSYNHVIDDIVVPAIDALQFLNKINSWFFLCKGVSPENISWHTRTSLLEYKLEQVRDWLRNGNWGLAKAMLEKIQTLLETFDNKATEIEQITAIVETIVEHIEKALHIPLISQLNTLNLSLASTTVAMGLIDEVGRIREEDKTERALEGLTTSMDVDHFLRKKRELLAEILDEDLEEEDKNEEDPLSGLLADIEESEISPQPSTQPGLASSQIKIRSSEVDFARKLVQRRMVSKQQLILALEEQKNMENRGKAVPLCNIMLINKMVLPEDIQRVFGTQAITTFFCKECEKTYRVLNLSHLPPQHFRCRMCKRALHYPPEEKDVFLLPDEDQAGEATARFEVVSESDIPMEITEDHVPILLQRASILAKKKEVDKALDIYDKILKILPENDVCHVGRSRIFVENKAYTKAVEEANQVLARNATNHQALCHRAVALYYLGELDKAIEDLSILVDNRVHNFMSYSTRGKAYFRQKQYRKAVEDLTRSLVMAPDFVKGYIYRGKAYLHLGKNKLAVHDFEEALKINPNYANAKEVRKLIGVARERAKR